MRNFIYLSIGNPEKEILLVCGVIDATVGAILNSNKWRSAGNARDKET